MLEKSKVHIKRRYKRRKVCYFCANKIDILDYKEIDTYSRFVTDRGKISPKRNTGVCAKHQRMLASNIKRARYMGLLPYNVD